MLMRTVQQSVWAVNWCAAVQDDSSQTLNNPEHIQQAVCHSPVRTYGTQTRAPLVPAA